MPITDIYSKRQKRLRGEVVDVFQYTEFPQSFRIQTIQIIGDTLGEPRASTNFLEKPYDAVAKTLCHEYGVVSLTISGKQRDSYSDTTTFIQGQVDIEKVLDAVELFCKTIEHRDTLYLARYYQGMKEPSDAIDELNARFLEHGIGFQYQSGEIIRIDSKLMHSEVVKPVLQLLSDPYYTGPNDEYLTAHEHYRKSEYKECLVDCLKAFESTMKAICDKRQWAYNKSSDAAKDLIAICFQNNLIPTYLQSQYAALRTSLESGIPTVRNKNAGHGQGAVPTTIPKYLASYLVHLTATTILMLIEAEKELP
jgi:hypothetical protein